jgi:two-component system OmpR family response regulator
MNRPAIKMDQVYCATKAGVMELSRASTKLLSDELQVLVLLSRPLRLRDVVPLFPRLTDQKVMDAAARLLQERLIGESTLPPDDGSLDFSPGSDAMSNASMTMGLEVQKARADLFQRGYYVTIARRAATQVAPRVEGSYTILLIEDDQSLLKLFDNYLRMQGFGTRTASDRAGIEAAFAVSPPPDLILLDLNLPDVGGFDILHMLSAHENMGSTPVVVASADTTKQSIVRALALGADGYITKPVELDSLTDAVRAVLGFPAIERVANAPKIGR